MTLHLDIFSRQFEQAQQQLTQLLQQAAQDDAPQSLLTQALDELTNALEEAHVLSEELAEQYNQLQAAQMTLTTERQQYFELFDLAPDGYIITNVQGMIEKINQTAVTLLNRHQHSSVGKPLAVMVAQADIHKFYTLLNRLQQGETFQDFSLRLQPYQKSSLYASFTIAPMRDYQSQLVGFRWLFRDLSQQRRATIALEESETQYRAIVENQTELVCRFLADGRLTFVNQAFCQYFDCSSESVIGENFFNLIGETSQETILQQLAILDRLDRDHPVVTFDHRVALSDGQVRWQQWVHRALFDRSGDFFQFQSAGRDITDQKRAEEVLQQREAQLCLVTDVLPILVTYINAKQQVIHANRTHKHWLGKSRGDIVGHYLWDVLGPSAYQQVRVAVEAALSGERVAFEQAVTLSHRPSFQVSVTLVPDQPEPGHVNGFFALVERLDLAVQESGANRSHSP
ncbi:PAS domain-containing protein [Leptolyngbya cf. ectocarpi LEGE 11479]|uniref:PAS domain-containing protein n=1 Tax=Leptolyngbya cf. ectocarpi LEGE 11479 TaxID=1828722 RepID=A0A929FCC4_LEPEC|nr:PAS domain-containing protein [Leptolyngbya ectocarpi]MBE9069849.1 PAS domain-containing protein [Leptolyngbya cf. ectocarpi LEGE 11479]